MDKLRIFGLIGTNGLVLVETKIPGNAAMVPRSENTFHIQGLSPRYAGRHHARSEYALRVPDLRTNLYWNPEVETDKSGEASFSFLASDVAGTFKIRIEGFTVEGEPFFAEEDFHISFKPD